MTDDPPPGPHLAVWVRLPPCLCTPRPVASSDAHFPFLLGEMTLFLVEVGLLFGLPYAGEVMGWLTSSSRGVRIS